MLPSPPVWRSEFGVSFIGLRGEGGDRGGKLKVEELNSSEFQLKVDS